MKKTLLVTVAAVSLLALAACGQKSSDSATGKSSESKTEKITVAGSTALQPLVEANVESFTQENTNSGEKGTLLHCWWECQLVQPLWKTV